MQNWHWGGRCSHALQSKRLQTSAGRAAAPVLQLELVLGLAPVLVMQQPAQQPVDHRCRQAAAVQLQVPLQPPPPQPARACLLLHPLYQLMLRR